MPYWFRVALALWSFFKFFVLAPILGMVLFPLIRLVTWTRDRHRRVCGTLIHRMFPAFLYWMKFSRLIDYDRDQARIPEGFPRDRGYVLVANHPTLIDTLFALAWFEGMICVVKASWFNSPFFGALMRSTHYLPGPGVEGDDARETPVLDRMVEQLREGRPILVFPEGTRAPPHEMLRFKRGAFEAAKRAGAPILPLFIGVDHPGLTKGVPLVPDGRIGYTFDYLPWTDCATDPATSQELRDRYAALFRDRHERYLRQLSAGDEVGSKLLSRG